LRIPGRSRASSPGPSNSNGSSSISSKASLLTRLHQLLEQLSDVAEVIKNWPSSQDSQVHYDTTTQLIEALNRTVTGLKDVELKVVPPSQSSSNSKNTASASNSSSSNHMGEAMSQAILNAPVPLDLLDLMDYGAGLNPEIFTKQLILEALRQLSGLRRRKEALEMLGKEVEKGMEQMLGTSTNSASKTATKEEPATTEPATGTRKRPRSNKTEEGEVDIASTSKRPKEENDQ
jgi:hypothetical protein